MNSQLDGKLIRDEKDGDMKKKYRERARSYIRKVREDSLIPFVIDDSDLTGRVEEEFYNLEDGLGEHVMREVIGIIFDSIGKSFLRLSVKASVEWDIRGS
jgi:hypothetical protein